MTFKLPSLPYPAHALEPHISRRTMEFHHGKHHGTYVDNLNRLIEGKSYASMSLDEIVRASAAKPEDRAIFNNAAQAWNHTEFWSSMRPGGGGEPSGEIAALLGKAFGGYAAFRQEFLDAAVGRFGSGWAWLVLDGTRLSVISTPNADTPLTSDKTPLLVCDVWEHAYYLDYQNRRKAFVEAFLDHLVDWESAALRLGRTETARAG